MSPRERLSQIDRDTAGQFALFVIGVCLLVVAPAAEPPSGTFLGLESGEPRDTVPENASVVEYRDMPPDTQDAFQAALEDDENEGHIRGGANVDALSGYEYIRYQGGYYQFYFVAVERFGLGQVLLVGGLGAVAIVVAGLWRFR